MADMLSEPSGRAEEEFRSSRSSADEPSESQVVWSDFKSAGAVDVDNVWV